jgi:hypothetical protein
MSRADTPPRPTRFSRRGGEREHPVAVLYDSVAGVDGVVTAHPQIRPQTTAHRVEQDLHSYYHRTEGNGPMIVGVDGSSTDPEV